MSLSTKSLRPGVDLETSNIPINRETFLAQTRCLGSQGLHVSELDVGSLDSKGLVPITMHRGWPLVRTEQGERCGRRRLLDQLE